MSRSILPLVRLERPHRASLSELAPTLAATCSCPMMLVPLVSVWVCMGDFYIQNCLGSALPGTNSSWMPHKGVLSPAEHSLYISTSDGSGPYDGTLVGGKLHGLDTIQTHK